MSGGAVSPISPGETDRETLFVLTYVAHRQGAERRGRKGQTRFRSGRFFPQFSEQPVLRGLWKCFRRLSRFRAVRLVQRLSRRLGRWCRLFSAQRFQSGLRVAGCSRIRPASLERAAVRPRVAAVVRRHSLVAEAEAGCLKNTVCSSDRGAVRGSAGKVAGRSRLPRMAKSDCRRSATGRWHFGDTSGSATRQQ